MTDQRKDGGPAFPGGGLPPHPHHPNGLTKREWFAGQALIGLLSTVHASKKDTAEVYADASYALADAMIARSKEGES